ncbi:MAG: CotH kinase family protein, partial [Chthoniobacteraceae bacterium]
SHPSYRVNGQIIDPTKPESNTNFTAAVNYQALLDLSNANLTVPANYDALLAKLDRDDFINYMLVNFYVGNSDWAHQNWYASYNRVKPDGKWRYHVWDAEHVMESVNYNGKITQDDPTGPTHIHQRLRTNPEYRLAFADAMHRHFFNNGVLTNPRVWNIFDAQMQTFAEAIRAESARWGDNRREPPYTRLDWFTQRDWWQNTYFPARSTVPGTNSNSVFFQLKGQGLYPNVNAPEFNTHGGSVPANFSLTMTGASTIYYTSDGSDPRVPITDAVAATATAYSGSVILSSSRTIKARVLNGGTWSALTEAYFSVNTEPAAAGNLVISKIHYNPAALTPAEVTAGFSERGDFEFLEVLNIGAKAVTLDDLSFSEGLDIAALPGGVREIAPGGRALYVAKPTTFEFRYGAGLPVAGEFSLGTNLSNSGEQLHLLAADQSTIVDFTYSDSAPWPTQPDGQGPSLVLMRPQTSDPSEGSNWRASTGVNGSPAEDDRLLYSTWQAAHFSPSDPGFPGIAQPGFDADGDGLENVLELFLGLDPKVPALPSSLPGVSVMQLDIPPGTDNYAVFTVRHVKAAEEIDWRAEATTNLSGPWSIAPADIVPLGPPVDNGDGTETRRYRSPLPIDSDPTRFFRTHVTLP